MPVKLNEFIKEMEMLYGLKVDKSRKEAILNILNESVGEEGIVDKEILLDLLLVGETYFMREKYHFDVLKENVLPLMKEGVLPSSILSAGCSTGEEAYSIRFVAIDGGVDPIVVGVDLNNKFIEKAREATYRKNSLRSLSETDINKWFDCKGGLYRVKEKYRKNTYFYVDNILELKGEIKKWAPFGAVFMRNVLIYMTREARKRAIGKIVEITADGGFIFFGISESIIDIPHYLSPFKREGVIYYRKGMKKEERRENTGALREDRKWEDELLLYYLEGKWDEFERALRRMKRKKKLSPFIYFFEALLREIKGDLDGALECTRKCIYLDANFYLAYWERGRVYELMGELEKAKQAYRKAHKLSKRKMQDFSIKWFGNDFMENFLRRKLEELEVA